MYTKRLGLVAPGLLAATALALAVSAGAQTPPVPSPAAAATGAQTPKASVHHRTGAKAGHDAEMKAECMAMMEKKQAMQAKVEAMDASLDKLVAEMNVAKTSKEVDALEKPMAAVLNELVAQRKVLHSMMMEMQSPMMGHMAHHMQMHGAKGAMECPMMKMKDTHEPKAEMESRESSDGMTPGRLD
jgi:Skp family chaperone for outer membrane proteins